MSWLEVRGRTKETREMKEMKKWPIKAGSVSQVGNPSRNLKTPHGLWSQQAAGFLAIHSQPTCFRLGYILAMNSWKTVIRGSIRSTQELRDEPTGDWRWSSTFACNGINSRIRNATRNIPNILPITDIPIHIHPLKAADKSSNSRLPPSGSWLD